MFGLSSQTALRVGIGILSVLLLALTVSRVIYPFDNGHYEAFNWLPAQHVLAGANPYSFARTEPYSMTPYGWVFYVLLAPGVKLFGLQLWWGRILATLGFAVSLWAVYRIARRLTNSREAAAATVLAALAQFPAQFWTAFVRPDFIALAFCLTALCFAFEIERRQTAQTGKIVLIAALLAAAFFTKQTFLLPVLLVPLRFVQTGNFVAARWFTILFALFAGAGVWLLNRTSNGGYVWQHFAHAQRLPFESRNLSSNFLIVAEAPAFFFLIVFLVIFIVQKIVASRQAANRAALLRRVVESPALLLWLYFLLSFAQSFAGSGRVGANANYYLENSFAAALVFGLVYHEFRAGAQNKIVIAATILIGAGGAFQAARLLRGEYFRWQALGYYREISATAARYIEPGAVCVGTFPELLAAHGCEFEFDDVGEYASGWEPELTEIFEREIKTGRFAAIVWNNKEFAERFPNYRLVPMSQRAPDKFYPIYLFVPVAAAPE